MKNRIMLKAKSRITVIHVLELTGIILFINTTNNIVNRGIYADVHKTSGAIPQMDFIVLLVALLLQVVAIGLFWKVIQGVNQQTKDNFKYKNLLYFTLWTMVLGGPCMVLIPLVPLFLIAALVLGITALYLSYDKRNKSKAYVLDCRILNVMVLFALLVQVTLSFTRT